jgi:membrane carboxypeptidase/penicillin-binding protein
MALAIIILVCITAYYVATVVQARRITPVMTDSILKSDAIRIRVADLPDGWLDMLLKVEDPRFYQHNGIDLSTPGAGITTVTQGMVKYLYFKNFKPGIAKLRQSLIAIFALNALVPKDTQLLIFINTVYLGQMDGKPVRGFEQAAEIYFRKRFNQLSTDEYLSLVAMIIAPSDFHITKHPEANAVRVERIKKHLKGEYIPKGLMDLYYDK